MQGKIRCFGFGVPPVWCVAQSVDAQPKRLLQRNGQLFCGALPAAKADGGANAPEQVALLFDLLAYLGEAPLDLDRLILRRIHGRHDTLAACRCHKAAVHLSQLLPDDLERVLLHGTEAVLIFCRGRNIRLDNSRKVAAAFGQTALQIKRAHGARGAYTAAHLSHQGVDDALLLALAALFQAVLYRCFLAHLLLEADQQIDHFLLLERLKQIAFYAVFERILRIFKLAVAADDDKMQSRLNLLCLPNEVNAVIAGHADIGHQQVRLLFAHLIECAYTVARHADNLKAKTFPVNQLAHQQQDLFFIICQYDP